MAGNTYPLAGGLFDARGKSPAMGKQTVVQPTGADKYRLGPSGKPPLTGPIRQPNMVQPAGQAPLGEAGPNALGRRQMFRMPTHTPVTPTSPATYDLTPPPASQPAPPPPSPSAAFAGRRAAGGLNSLKPPAPAPVSGQTGRQAVNQTIMRKSFGARGVAPQVAGAAPAPAPSAAGPSGQTVWQALHPQGSTPGVPGQHAWNALMGPSGGASAAPVSAAPAPAAPAPRPSLGARLAGSAGRGVKSMIGTPLRAVGRMAPGAIATAMIDSASDNPSEGFMHLGQQGSAAAGLGRVMSTLGHKLSGQSAPTDITGGQLYDSFMHHTPIGDTFTGAYNWAAHPQQSFVNLGTKLNGAVDSAGQWMSGKGDSMMADATPGAAAPASEGSDVVVPGGRGMNADQLNSQYEKLGVGGEHPADPSHPSIDPVMDRLRSMGSQTAPKSGDTPAVTGSGQAQAGPINPDLGRVGYADMGLDHAAFEAAMNGNYEAAASLGQALANMRGQAGGVQAHMLGSRAQMAGVHADAERANNPLAGYMNPVGLHILDQQYGGTGNIVGAGQAAGIGLGPNRAVSPIGMKQYASMKHPAFASLVGNREASVDQWRDAYNGVRGRFADGDQQLVDLNHFLSQALQQQFSPEELDAAAQPGWFGSGAAGAGQNQQFYRHTGVR